MLNFIINVLRGVSRVAIGFLLGGLGFFGSWLRKLFKVYQLPINCKGLSRGDITLKIKPCLGFARVQWVHCNLLHQSSCFRCAGSVANQTVQEANRHTLCGVHRWCS